MGYTVKLKLIAIGKNMPSWINEGFTEYQKRLPPSITLQLIEIPLQKRSKKADTKKLMAQEGEQMLKAIDANDLVISLEVQGKPWLTDQLAQQLQQWHDDSQNIALLVGGPEGLAPACLARTQLHWSLSPLTLPHPLVRVIIAEQIYRAWSINAGHPYHR